MVLDSQSDWLIQEVHDAVIQRWTSMIIAHRLGLIKATKRIFVFDAIELMEEGSHEELLQKGALLVKQQLMTAMTMLDN